MPQDETPSSPADDLLPEDAPAWQRLGLEPIVQQGLTQQSVDLLSQVTSAAQLPEIFPDFYSSEFVRACMTTKRWTVSDEEKRPLDFVAVVEEGRIRGAYRQDDTCLVDLPAVMTGMPGAVNHAYRLLAARDGYLILDVEKTCRPSLAVSFLQLLPWLYAERSMSGKGFHLVMPLPANYARFPNAATHMSIKSPKRTYEILADQFATFTRESIPQSVKTATPAEAEAHWENLYEELAADLPARNETKVDVSGDKPEIAYEEAIVADLVADVSEKTVRDFHNNWSSYHFHLISRWRRRLGPLLQLYSQMSDPTDVDDDGKPSPPPEYGPVESAWLVYEALIRTVPHRPKHDGTRNGLPFLLDRVCWAMGTEAGDIVAASPDTRS